MRAVAADGVAVRHLTVEAVAGRLLGQVLEEGRVEDGHLRQVGHEPAGHRDALEVGGVVQRPQGHQLLNELHHRVVNEGRAREVAPALDHPVAHRHHVGLLEAGALLVEQPQDLGQAEAVVGHGLVNDGPGPVVLVDDGAHGVANTLHQPRGQGVPGVGVNELVLNGGGSGVNDEDGPGGHARAFRGLNGVLEERTPGGPGARRATSTGFVPRGRAGRPGGRWRDVPVGCPGRPGWEPRGCLVVSRFWTPRGQLLRRRAEPDRKPGPGRPGASGWRCGNRRVPAGQLGAPGPGSQPWAWTAVMATVLIMSSTRAPRERSLTGLFRPWRTGPMAIAPDERCTAL